MVDLKIRDFSFKADFNSFNVKYTKFEEGRSGCKDNRVVYHDYYSVMDSTGCHLKLVERIVNNTAVDIGGNDVYQWEEAVNNFNDSVIELEAFKDGELVFQYEL